MNNYLIIQIIKTKINQKFFTYNFLSSSIKSINIAKGRATKAYINGMSFV
jgi:hypothetical protein